MTNSQEHRKMINCLLYSGGIKLASSTHNVVLGGFLVSLGFMLEKVSVEEPYWGLGLFLCAAVLTGMIIWDNTIGRT